MRLAARLLGLTLACLLVGLPLAAVIDPPDPTWVSGYWDDDDFDSVVVLILHSTAIAPHVAIFPGPVGETRPLVVGRSHRVTVVPVTGVVGPRAPPVAPSA